MRNLLGPAAFLALPVVLVLACSDDADGTGPPSTTPDAGCVEGSRVANQTAGDCQAIVCAAGGTTRAVPDDADLPAATECATPSCTGGSPGSTPKESGTACTGGLCDGAGTCVQKPLGADCADASACPSGFCVDGVCCNEACTAACKACNNAGSKGVCSNLPYYAEDSFFLRDGAPVNCTVAVGGARCDGNGNCRRTVGVACNDPATCMSGNCTNMECLGAKDELCSAPQECASGTCSFGSCL